MQLDALTVGVREAAASLGLSHWTIRRFIKQGKLPAVKLGRRTLLEIAELQKLVERNRIGERNHEHRNKPVLDE